MDEHWADQIIRDIDVLSDDPRASASIESFTDGEARWLVAVRMVSINRAQEL